MKPCHLVVMAKAPVPGFAKTRLVPALGDEGAARLAARLLDHALQQHPAFAAQAQQGGVLLVPQGEGDLGARMRSQFSHEFDRGAGCVVLIGTDAPGLTAATLRRAARALASLDAVFVPAADGGYALIGLRRVMPALFDSMPWSTGAVMALTRDRLRHAAARHAELPEVHDIDEPADLVHLPAGWPSS